MKEVEAPACGLAMNGMWSQAETITVVPDEAGVAELLVQQLAFHGVIAKISKQVDEQSNAVVFLAALNEVTDVVQATQVNKQAFFAAKAVADRYQRDGGIFVTVQRSGGDFGLRGKSGMHAWTAGLTGLTKTMALEWPLATVKAIDLESSLQDPAECATQIANEMLFGGPEDIVGLYANDKRTTLALDYQEARSIEETPLANIEDKPVVVVSGGGRGVTAASIMRLAQARECRFVLLGRTQLLEEPSCCADLTEPMQMQQALILDDSERGLKRMPAEINRQIRQFIAAREIRSTIASLQQLGSEAKYVPLDVRNTDQVSQQLSEVREAWGPIHAIVHGSGVLADKRIADKTGAQFDLVFETKVSGLHSLLEATKEDPLQAIILFSSIVSQSGNEGQADYAMANEVMNKVAAVEATRRQGSCLVRSIKWGPVDGGMVDSQIKEIFRQKQLPLISIDEAADCFVREFMFPADDTEVLICHGTTMQPHWGQMKRTEWTMEVKLHERFQPYLLDHQVQQTVVLPVVQVVEWLMRFVKAIVPEAPHVAISNLNVRKGVLLSQFKHKGHRLFMHCRIIHEDDKGTEFAMELKSCSGQVHYTSTVEVSNEQGVVQVSEVEKNLGTLKLAKDEYESIHRRFAAAGDVSMESWNWKEREVYDGELLFHGPAFQVIQQANGMTSCTVAGELKSNLSSHWGSNKAEKWQTVPDLLDGGMQMGRLWAIQYHDLPFLPMRIRRFAMHQPMAQYDELFCIVKCGTIGKLAAKGDIYFYASTGQLVAEMTGVEGFRVS